MTDGTQKIIMAHGGGGELTRLLLAEHVIPQLTNDMLAPLTDSATIALPGGDCGCDGKKICMTTDSFVVQPLEFPGGDIGRLAVCGTVNDLAMAGASPLALSLAVVLEEGLEIETFRRMIQSVAAAAREAGVAIATGDTKVIERRTGDGMIITTTGVGQMRSGADLDAGRIGAGDVVIINGNIAEHGLAVMSAREGLAFDTDLRSDVASLNGLVADLLDSGADVKFLRDPTRGGLAGVLADLTEETGLSVEVEEAAVPISNVALHTAEMLGLDPLTVANEGKLVVVVAAADAQRALDACRKHELGRRGAIIGKFTDAAPPLVELITRAGGRRMINRPYGEQLPRIC
jgi:hydrogenase expression/formation protein HypE